MKKWQIGVVSCIQPFFVILIVAICSSCVFLDLRDTMNFEDCVLVSPREAVSGHIESPGTMYYVLYRGTTKSTGEACSRSVLVTESEYERVIYGEERHDLSVQD